MYHLRFKGMRSSSISSRRSMLIEWRMSSRSLVGRLVYFVSNLPKSRSPSRASLYLPAIRFIASVIRREVSAASFRVGLNDLRRTAPVLGTLGTWQGGGGTGGGGGTAMIGLSKRLTVADLHCLRGVGPPRRRAPRPRRFLALGYQLLGVPWYGYSNSGVLQMGSSLSSNSPLS